VPHQKVQDVCYSIIRGVARIIKHQFPLAMRGEDDAGGDHASEGRELARIPMYGAADGLEPKLGALTKPKLEAEFRTMPRRAPTPIVTDELCVADEPKPKVQAELGTKPTPASKSSVTDKLGAKL